MTYTGDVPADGVLALRAGARCAKPVQATARTEFRGVPAVLLEVTDNPDPVPVGGTVTYTITVTNQGNTPLHHVLVKCSLEEAMEFAGSDGPTPGKGAGRAVTFDPLGDLAPKAKAVWAVRVKALQQADARFQVQVTSDEVPRPAEKLESTHFVPQTP